MWLLVFVFPGPFHARKRASMGKAPGAAMRRARCSGRKAGSGSGCRHGRGGRGRLWGEMRESGGIGEGTVINASWIILGT